MKKLFYSAIYFFCCCIIMVSSVSATDTDSPNLVINRTVFSDGSYVIETISECANVNTARSTNSKTGSKTAVYYDSSDVAIFGVKVTGSFEYNGSTSEATNSVATVYIYDSSATYVSKSATYSGNTASATGKVKYNYVTIPLTTSLSCDKNGNLS